MTEIIEAGELLTPLLAPRLQGNGFIALHIRIKTGEKHNAGAVTTQVTVGQDCAVSQLQALLHGSGVGDIATVKNDGMAGDPGRSTRAEVYGSAGSILGIAQTPSGYMR